MKKVAKVSRSARKGVLEDETQSTVNRARERYPDMDKIADLTPAGTHNAGYVLKY